MNLSASYWGQIGERAPQPVVPAIGASAVVLAPVGGGTYVYVSRTDARYWIQAGGVGTLQTVMPAAGTSEGSRISSWRSHSSLDLKGSYRLLDLSASYWGTGMSELGASLLDSGQELSCQLLEKVGFPTTNHGTGAMCVPKTATAGEQRE